MEFYFFFFFVLLCVVCRDNWKRASENFFFPFFFSFFLARVGADASWEVWSKIAF